MSLVALGKFRFGSAVGTAALAAALCGCSASASVSIGSSPGLSQSKMRALVLTVTTREGLTAQSVSCPSGVPLKAGLVSYCTAHYASGETSRFLVRQTDANGDVNAAPAEMTAPAIEQNIRAVYRSQRGLTVTASCPSGVPIVVANRFDCTVRDGSQTAVVPVKITDADGGFALGTSAR